MSCPTKKRTSRAKMTASTEKKERRGRRSGEPSLLRQWPCLSLLSPLQLMIDITVLTLICSDTQTKTFFLLCICMFQIICICMFQIINIIIIIIIIIVMIRKKKGGEAEGQGNHHYYGSGCVCHCYPPNFQGCWERWKNNLRKILLKIFKERPSKLEKGYSQVLVKQSLPWKFREISFSISKVRPFDM